MIVTRATIFISPTLHYTATINTRVEIVQQTERQDTQRSSSNIYRESALRTVILVILRTGTGEDVNFNEIYFLSERLRLSFPPYVQ